MNDSLADRITVAGTTEDGRTLLSVPPGDFFDAAEALSAWRAS